MIRPLGAEMKWTVHVALPKLPMTTDTKSSLHCPNIYTVFDMLPHMLLFKKKDLPDGGRLLVSPKHVTQLNEMT